MNPAMMLKYGIKVIVRRIGALPDLLPLHAVSPTGSQPTINGSCREAAWPWGRSTVGSGGTHVGGGDAASIGGGGSAPSPSDLVLAAQVEQFFHAQGYSQYRVLGLKDISCG